MSVTFLEDEKDKSWRWVVCSTSDDEDDEEPIVEVLHESHKAFSSKESALDNVLANHALMAIFLTGVIRCRPSEEVSFEDYEDGTRWVIKAQGGGYVGAASEPAAHIGKAADDLFVIYALLAMYVATLAQERFV